MAIPDEGSVPTQDESNASHMGQLDDIIDLVTDRFIQFDMGGDVYDGGTNHHVYETDMYPWEWLVQQGGFSGSPQEAKEYFLNGGQAPAGDDGSMAGGSAVETDDDQVIIQRSGAAFTTPDVFVKHKGKKWMEVRGWFEGIKKPYETALSFQQNAFISPEMRMGFAVDDLIPVGSITDADVEELSRTDVSNAGDDPAISSDLNDRLNGNDNWNDARTADRFLEGWQGRGAQVFKWTFLERRPSILVGQSLTARALHQSVEILNGAYTNVRSESYSRMWDAQEIFELYPFHNGTGSSATDWKNILTNVAGVATIVAGGATMVSWNPAGATVAGIATIVAGGASLGANIVESPGHEAEVSKKLKIEGEKVADIYWNWYDQIQSFINTVLNSEQVIGDNLTALRTRIEQSKTNSGASLVTTFGDQVDLTEYQSFFAPKAPGEGSFTPGTVDGMGPSSPNGDSGAAFSGDLNELFKVAVNHLPAVASVYSQQAGREADGDMSSATQRTMYESSPYGGDSYASQSNGAALQPWLDLHAAYEEMMNASATNFQAAAEDLKSAAIYYRDKDDEAAENLDEVFQNLEDVEVS